MHRWKTSLCCVAALLAGLPVVSFSQVPPAPASPPQLVEARYRAALTETALVGTGQWRVIHRGRVAGVLPLQPLNLALRQPHFVNTEKKDALVADLDGASPGLLVEQPGEHTVVFEWSLRGEAGPGPESMQFHLEVPACGVATLELDLPEDKVVSVNDGMVTGPQQGATGRRLWTVAFSRRAGVDLKVQAAPEKRGPEALLTRSHQSRIKLAPDAVEAEFLLDVEVLRGDVRRLVCEFDPALRLHEVTAPQLEKWEVGESKGGAPSLLTLQLRESLRGGALAVRGTAPLGAGDPRPWAAPWLRLRNAVPRGENLTVHVPSDVTLEGWQPGDFRLVEATVEGDGQVLKLAGGLAGEGASARPSARLRTQRADFRVRQLAWWKVGPDRPSLVVQVGYEMLRGRLFRLSLALPPGYDVERVSLNPPGLLRGWDVRPGGASSVLQVELQQPLVPPTPEAPDAARAAPPRLTAHLRGPAAPAVNAAPLAFAFPDVVPVGAMQREGGLAVDFDEQRYEPSVSGATAAPPPDDGPWGKDQPDNFYPYRGQDGPGRLELRPLSPRLRARCTSSVVLTSARAAVETTLQLHSEAGAVPAVELHVAAPVAGAWDWKAAGGGNSVVRFERMPAQEAAGLLHLLAARDGLGAAALLAAGPQGEWRRLVLARPLLPREPLTLQVTCELPRSPDGTRWEVPLVTVPAAARMDGEVVLHLAGANLVQVESRGLREAAPSGPRPEGPAPWRALRYGTFPSLALRGQVLEADRSAEAVIDRVALTTAGGSGRLRHHFRFRAWNWRQPTLPVRLPAGARLLAVRYGAAWVDYLPPPEEIDGALQVELPVPAPAGGDSEGPHGFELVYETAAPCWSLWAELEAPAPTLPVPPADFRRTWRLPAGVVPLSDRFRPSPGSAGPLPGSRGGRVLDLLPPSWVLRPLALPEWETQQQRDLEEAAAAVRRQLGRDATLAEALLRLAGDHLPGQGPLVLDTAALEEAGLTPATPLPLANEPAPFWEGLGLTAVPCRAAPLLTTRRQRDAWLTAGAAPLPPAAEVAVAQAAAHGHDPSGRFRRAVAWVRQSVADRNESTLSRSLMSSEEPGWVEWEPTAGGDAGDAVTVVRQGATGPAGLAAALGLLLAFWLVRRSEVAWRLRFVLAWIGVAGLGLLWLPASLEGLAWWPLLAGGAVGVCWYVWSAARARPQRPPARAAAAGVAAAALALASLTAPVRAAPLDLPRGAVLVAAEYRGKLGAEHADFEAVLKVHNFDDGPATLALPFAGVRLQDDGLLDGARAYVVAAAPPQAGYVVKLEKPGARQLTLRFRVPVHSAAGGERELQFTVPRVTQGRLTLEAPGAKFLQALTRQGEHRVTGPGTHEIDLGRVAAPLHFRWRTEGGTDVAPVVRVREAYLWNLRPDSAALSAVLHYTVTAGAPTGLAVEVPESLEVRRVTARAAAPASTAPLLKGCKVVPGKLAQRLEMEFQAPLRGGAYVLIDLVPRRPLGREAALALLNPVDARFESGFLAYRARGLDAQVAGLEGLKGPYFPERDPAVLDALDDLWHTARETSPVIDAAYVVPRDPGGNPFLRLALRPAPARGRAALDVAWRVGLRQAELSAIARLTAPDGDLALVEWDVPEGVTVTRVTGKGPADVVRHWSRSGRRVQAWLHRAVPAAELELLGWAPLAAAKEGGRFDLPVVRLVAAPPVTTAVRLTADSELALEPVETAGLLPLPDPRPPERELSYLVRGLQYGGRFHIRTTTDDLDARLLTAVEVRDRELRFTATIEYRPRRGELRRVQVRLRNWEGGDPQLEAKQAARRPVERRGPDERSWVIDLDPGARGPYRLSLSGSLPLEGAGLQVPMPEVSVPGVGQPERWLAVGGRELTAEGPQRLQSVAADAPAWQQARQAWPAEAERALAAGGSLWRVEGDGWALRLLPHYRPPRQAIVRLYLTERRSAVADGRHWAHEAVWWLYHEANTDLSVSLPVGACVLSVVVDGLPVVPLQPTPETLWLPLPGSAGARRVRLRWAFAPGSEPLERPQLQGPQLLGAEPGPVSWVLHVPAEYTATLPGGLTRKRLLASSEAGLDLARAEAQYHLCRALAEQPSGGLPTAQIAVLQRRFYRLCRYAEYARAAAGHPPESNLRGMGLDDWLKVLRESNQRLAQDHGFEKVRAEAERQARSWAPPEPGDEGDLAELSAATVVAGAGPRDDALPARGTPLYWQTESEVSSPAVTLTPARERRTKQAVAFSALLLVLLAAVWMLARLPDLLAWVQAFWPEQLALLGCLGWQAYGANVWLLALVAVGVAARLVLLGQRLLAGLQRVAETGGARTGSSLVKEPRSSSGISSV